MARRVLIDTLISAILLVALVSCLGISEDPSQQILGRWQRVREVTLGDPLGSLASEYVEFREGGQLITLMYDKGPDTFWTTNKANFSFPESGRIEVQGFCWQGWERYDCSGEYSYTLSGDRLQIMEDQDPNSQAEYKRIGALDPDPPPTLVPPFATPTPGT